MRFEIVLGLVLLSTSLSAQGTRADYDRARHVRDRTAGKVFRDRVRPTWQGDRFTYRVDFPDGGREFILVDAKARVRDLAFDHAKLAEALAKASSATVDSKQLPIDRVIFSEDRKHLLFNALGKGWDCALENYAVTARETVEVPEQSNRRRGGRRGQSRGRRGGVSPRGRSPDENWHAFIRDNNLFVRPAKEEGEAIQLTSDGNSEDAYSDRIYWSPDSKRLVVLRRAREEQHTVYWIESSPKGQLQPKIKQRQYLKPGDRIAKTRPHLFDIEAKKEIPVSDALFSNPWRLDSLRWREDSKSFSFFYNQRGHQALRIVSIDASSGEARAIIDERSETFLDYAYKSFLHHVSDSEIIWMSERDGWNHLYLFDAEAGVVKNQITQGSWVVRGVDRVDDEKRQIWFRASGVYPGQDPYYIHYCRVDYDGSNMVILTEGDGTHDITFSPSGDYFIDMYSRVDLPPVHELRKTSDGKLVCLLESADWSALLETGWHVPERFVAKGRDGETDIYGIIFRPSNFDPSKTYPVIESIYAGPHGSHVPKGFRSHYNLLSMAELGFVIVKIDGMGTSNRSKAFHDICWKNLKDGGFPDRILWMQAAAAQYPYMDLSRVGIYGGSAGGQNTMAALLFHPDFYKVGVADCGCHDNRMDKIWWNELWMGWPVDEAYADNSNVTHAHRLRGKLMLTVGELDTNVDPSSTLQVVDALIKADKDFDFMMVPGAGHGIGESSYLKRRRRDFFVRHLHGVEPRKE